MQSLVVGVMSFVQKLTQILQSVSLAGQVFAAGTYTHCLILRTI